MLVISRKDNQALELITSDGTAVIWFELRGDHRVVAKIDAPQEIRVNRIDQNGDRETRKDYGKQRVSRS